MSAAIPKPLDAEEFLAREDSKSLLRFTTAGSVDDGKSTLIGRLLHDAHGAYDDQLRSARRDGGVIDFALLTDGLRAEREQGITIDVAYRYFSTSRRKFILADTPGHEQYTRNMATGASTAELAIILVDAARGVTPQTLRHVYIANLLGVRRYVIAVNKMDLVQFEENVFLRIREGLVPLLSRLGLREPYFLPMSALLGDNVVEPSRHMPWFDGQTLLEHLETVETTPGSIDSPFRMAVQRVVRSNPNSSEPLFRGYAGQIASGIIRPGDEILALPSGLRSKIERIVTFDGDLEEAHAPMSVTVTLSSELDIGRGDMFAAGNPPEAARSIEAMLVWFDSRPLDPAREYLIKHTTQTVAAFVNAIEYRVNVETLQKTRATALAMNEIGAVRLATARPLFVDPYHENRTTGAFILIDRLTNATAAAGMILSPAEVGVENQTDRLARLVRAVSSQARIDLPAEDEAAKAMLKEALRGFLRDTD